MSLADPSADLVFPQGFRFGIAESDLQVIGENYTVAEEGSELTMWRHFCEAHGMAAPGVGIDRYHRWHEDIDHIKRLGVQHYRTSVSMARTLTREGNLNPRAIEWYRQYFGALKKAGISIYATLYHWELPQHLHEAGGWPNRQTALAFQRHTEVVVEQLGDLIDEFFILCEPWCNSMLSYYEGIHAPGRQHVDDRENLQTALLAAHNLLLAQGLSFRSIKERLPAAKVSTVLNFQPAYAASSSPEDILAARYGDGYFNTWFIDPIYTGRYPQVMLQLYGEDAMPPDYETEMDIIRIGDKLHALGLNYYRGAMYRAREGLLPFEEVQIEGAPTNDLDWPIYQPPYYPEGFYDILQQVYFGYRSHGLDRIYITENGMALASERQSDSREIVDERRIEYFSGHLRQVHKAILHGVPVEAYFAWTLMDNFEWAEGYRPESEFGLIHVDRTTLERTWKKSAVWYGRVVHESRFKVAANLES